ncbi:hypothetical protein VKT23_001872 [Stygiomarasmius scandens]|uniref:Uncharacterized protein n=1 Tax=Marasmiellus scandens TaxID=2682957 RepID=A0ABR1K4C6_9AGAR
MDLDNNSYSNSYGGLAPTGAFKSQVPHHFLSSPSPEPQTPEEISNDHLSDITYQDQLTSSFGLEKTKKEQ